MIDLAKRSLDSIAKYTYGAGFALAGLTTIIDALAQGQDVFGWILFPIFSLAATKWWLATMFLGAVFGTIATITVLPFAMLYHHPAPALTLTIRAFRHVWLYTYGAGLLLGFAIAHDSAPVFGGAIVCLSAPQQFRLCRNCPAGRSPATIAALPFAIAYYAHRHQSQEDT